MHPSSRLSYGLLASCLLALLATAPSATASLDAASQHDHVRRSPGEILAAHVAAKKRMVKVRNPIFGFNNANNANGPAAQPTTTTAPVAQANPTTTTTPAPAAGGGGAAAATTTTAAADPNNGQGSPDGGLSLQAGGTTTSGTASLSSTSSTTTTAAVTSSTPLVQAAPHTTSTPTTTLAPFTVAIQSTISALPSESVAAATAQNNAFGRNTIIAIVVIASCVGGAAAIWTLIRKWKLGPSARFEDRMQPIEWAPEQSTADKIGGPGAGGMIEKSRRGSDGSFHSSELSHNNSNNLGRNVTGNANMFADQNPAAYEAGVPAHDFTAGPSETYGGGYNANPGYVDLQRANSGPKAELTREPSAGGHAAYGQQHAYGGAAYGQDAYAQDAYAQDAYGGYDAYAQQPAAHDPYAGHDQYAPHPAQQQQYGAYQGGRY